MALTRFEPFALDLSERWKHLFDMESADDRWIRVEEVHEDGTLVVRAELPGVDPDKDVDMSITDGVLHIAARRSEQKEEKSEKSYRSEFRYGSFRRDLRLPPGVDNSDVTAQYADGILEVRIPWPAKRETSVEKIPITRG